MSAMRSASSTTTIDTSAKERAPRPDQIRKTARAGYRNIDTVAQGIELSTKTDPAVERGHPFAALRTHQQSDLALDLGRQLAVGASIRARGRPGSARLTRVAIGNPKAMVLPEPVGPGRIRPFRPRWEGWREPEWETLGSSPGRGVDERLRRARRGRRRLRTTEKLLELRGRLLALRRSDPIARRTG